jgi:hypothetical protein
LLVFFFFFFLVVLKWELNTCDGFD